MILFYGEVGDMVRRSGTGTETGRGTGKVLRRNDGMVRAFPDLGFELAVQPVDDILDETFDGYATAPGFLPISPVGLLLQIHTNVDLGHRRTILLESASSDRHRLVAVAKDAVVALFPDETKLERDFHAGGYR